MATEGSAVETMESVLDIATRRAGLKSEVGRDDRSAPERPPLTVAKSLPPDPEVTEKPVRRKFTAEFKSRILREADICSNGELGALLRREGLYYSHLTDWRRQRERAELDALAPKKRGRKGTEPNPLAKRVAELERENRQLQRRLQKAEVIIDVQKKIAGLLGIPLSNPDQEGGD